MAQAGGLCIFKLNSIKPESPLLSKGQAPSFSPPFALLRAIPNRNDQTRKNPLPFFPVVVSLTFGAMGTSPFFSRYYPPRPSSRPFYCRDYFRNLFPPTFFFPSLPSEEGRRRYLSGLRFTTQKMFPLLSSEFSFPPLPLNMGFLTRKGTYKLLFSLSPTD